MLKLELMGRPALSLEGVPLTPRLSQKALALVCYLTLTGQPHSRELLAGLLWSDSPEERARRNLRVELTKLRPLLGDFLVIRRRSVAFDRERDRDLDVARFEAIVTRPAATVVELEEAVSLYRGEFLEDFQVRGALLFEEWVLGQRERLRQRALQALLRLAELYTQQGQLPQGIQTAERLLALEPWLESGHRQLMTLLALSGQRSAALAQYDACYEALMAELGVEPDEQTTALYEQIAVGDLTAADVAPHVVNVAPASPPTPFQPLLPSAHFVGRDAERARVQAALTRPAGPHLYALVGMGGVGKSALATQVAHALRVDFPDGVLWANVAASDPLDILDNWGRAYGYDFSGLPDVESRAAAVRGILAEKRVLVVLDDVASLAPTRPLLPTGPGCAILMTTRNLDVAHALNATVLPLSELSPADGRRLMISILGEARVLAEPEAADEICARLQQLPLAVEITAQRLRTRQRQRLGDMARRLRDVQQRLALQISDRAVRAAFQVSWQALDADLRRTFRLLAVFGGRPFTAAALAHVAEADEDAAEDDLFALTALSLLDEEGVRHYRQHALLADFAEEKMAGEGTAARGRMAEYYLRFAEANHEDYEALRPEWPNLLAGMRVAHEQQRWPWVLAYAEALGSPWRVRARFDEMRQGMAWAWAAAQALKDEHAAARVLRQWGEACLEQTDYEAAADRLGQSLELYRRLGVAAGIAEAQYHLARLAIERAQYSEAEHLLEESQQLREQAGDARGVALVLYRRAMVQHARGSSHEAAEALCQRALAIQRTLDEQDDALPTLRLLAQIAVVRADYEAATAFCDEAQQLCEALQNRGELAAILYVRAQIEQRQGHADAAEAHAEQSLALFERMGNRRVQAMLLNLMSLLQKEGDDVVRGLELARASLRLFRSVEDDIGCALALGSLSHFLRRSGEVEQARAAWQEAHALAASLGHTRLLAHLKQFEG